MFKIFTITLLRAASSPSLITNTQRLSDQLQNSDFSRTFSPLTSSRSPPSELLRKPRWDLHPIISAFLNQYCDITEDLDLETGLRGVTGSSRCLVVFVFGTAGGQRAYWEPDDLKHRLDTRGFPVSL